MRNQQQRLSPSPVEVDDTMNEPASKSRFAIDLEDLEKQLKMPPAPARGGDALAELARIVGRDDPLKGLFANRQAAGAPQSAAPSLRPSNGTEQRIEPSFGQPGDETERPNLRGALDEFDALLRRDLSSRVEPKLRQEPTVGSFQDQSAHAQPVRPQAYEPPAYEPPAYDTPAYEAPAAEIAISSQPPTYHAAPSHAAPRAEPVIMDRYVEDLEQTDRDRIDPPMSRNPDIDGMPANAPHDLRHDMAMQDMAAHGLAMHDTARDERRAPHDLDEPREIGRPARAIADDQLSRDLDEQLNAYPLPPVDDVDDLRPLTPRRSRKGLVTVGVLLGVASLGVAAAMTYRTMPKAAIGEPPIIKAETGPNKIVPLSPGGTEVPNQNKQIYERTGETRVADTKVVSREEQPVDVQQAARTAARVILPGPGGPATDTANAAAPVSPSSPTAPAASPSAAPVAGLGEPRRVRTVSIRPDGSVAAPAGSAAPAPSTPAALPPGRTSPVPTLVLPQAALGPQPPSRPVLPASRPAVPRVTAPEDASADAGAPLKLNAPTLARPKVQDRITDRVASAPAPASAAVAAPATASETPVTGGGFAVQLAAPGSEAEARSTFAALQRKYPEALGSQSPLIRKAEVNGREVYRLRVGPLSRDGATSLCTRLKSAGGNCFIAQN